MTLCFFVTHNALRWGISFCIVVDIKHLGMNIIVTELCTSDDHAIYGANNNEEMMHIRTPTHSKKHLNVPTSTKPRARHDFTQINNWDLESCTDTDTDLTTSDFDS